MVSDFPWIKPGGGTQEMFSLLDRSSCRLHLPWSDAITNPCRFGYHAHGLKHTAMSRSKFVDPCARCRLAKRNVIMELFDHGTDVVAD